MPTHFLAPEAEEGAEEELSHVSRVVKTDIKPWIVQTGRWTEVKLTSLRRSRGSDVEGENAESGKSLDGCTRFF
jgi:hypothetical protein